MHSPDHAVEALEWLYGTKWHSHGHGNYSGGNLCASESDSGKWCVERHRGYPEEVYDLTDRIKHALTVTEPWEWVADDADRCTFKNGRVSVRVRDYTTYAKWSMEFAHFDFKEMACIERNRRIAKESAREFFLTYMRGRLALRGLEK